MAWSSARPQEQTWEDKELYSFLREIHRRLVFGSFTWNPPNVPAASTVDTTLTTSTVAELRGLRTGMVATVSPPSAIDAGLIWGAWVPADDQLTIRLANVTAGGINPGSGTWAFQGVIS